MWKAYIIVDLLQSLLNILITILLAQSLESDVDKKTYTKIQKSYLAFYPG